MRTDFTGLTADQILVNPVVDSSSWHFFQARAWLDYAQRTQRPSAVHYAAFELRYGVEYLLFELLVLANDSLTQAEYQRCLGDPHKMKKMLKSLGTNYSRLTEFTKTVLSLDTRAPKLRYWSVDELFRHWGVASECLHFMGAQALTYQDINWLIRVIARLDASLKPIWESVTQTLGMGVMRPSQMQPEVHAAWLEFSSGSLSADDLRTRMEILIPVLRCRTR